jgi:hypothetical protein
MSDRTTAVVLLSLALAALAVALRLWGGLMIAP